MVEASARPAGQPHHKRAQGALEAMITKILLDADTPLNAGEVRDRLPDADEGPLSYSTVVTVLTRLHDKQVLDRTRDGRAYRYAPVTDGAGLSARRLNDVLDAVSDRDAVLTRFVDGLSAHDEALVRRLLEAHRAAGS